MARINTRTSATPLPTRASTTDSLYRDPTPAPHDARTSTYSVISPSQSIGSDKENARPATRGQTPQPRKGRPMAPRTSHRMLTPDSGSTAGSNGNKRRRTGEYSMAEEEDSDNEQPESDNGDPDLDTSQGQAEEGDEEGTLRYYNPNQNPDKRRRLRASMRDHQRAVDENRDEMIKPNSKLLDALKIQNGLFGKVRQTADAALDSRFLVNASELAGKKLNNSLQGNTGVGIDIDQFVSKCIFFMKSGGHVSGEEDAPAMPVTEDEEEDGNGLDWALLGRHACFPGNRRPPVSSFLLGPLSVEKRARVTQRRARSQRQPVGPAIEAQEIQRSDIQQSEKSNLSNLVKSIKTRLENHLEEAVKSVEDELSEIQENEIDEEDQEAACRRFRVTQDGGGEPAVSLLDFAINPSSFGQTVENLFYISFLVREGNAIIVKDSDGLPLLMPGQPRGVSEQRENNAQKHQAVFSIDYPTWKMFIDAYDIKDSLIPHREEEQTNVTARGWYAA